MTAAAPRRRVEAATPSFDSLQVGEVHISYARTLTESHLVQFTAMAGMTLPVFIDQAAAAAGPFGAPIAPGFLTASLSGGMMESVLGRHVLAGLGMDGFRFKAPVHIGDTLHAEIAIVDKTPTSDVHRGVVAIAVEVLNQRGESVLVYSARIMMRREATRSTAADSGRR